MIDGNDRKLTIKISGRCIFEQRLVAAEFREKFMALPLAGVASNRWKSEAVPKILRRSVPDQPQWNTGPITILNQGYYKNELRYEKFQTAFANRQKHMQKKTSSTVKLFETLVP